MKNQNKSFIWLIIFLVGFPQISETIYTPSLSYLASDFGVTDNQIQKTLSIYFAGFAVGVFSWGILSDIIGRKSSMMVGILLYITGSFLCLQSHSFCFLLFARFVQALGAAVGSNVSQTMLRDVFSDKERVNVFSTISAVLAFSPAIGPLLGSIVTAVWNVYTVFTLLIIIGCIAFFWSLFGLKETLPSHSKSSYDFRRIAGEIRKDKAFWIYGGLIGVANGVIFSYYGEAPFIFIDYFKFSIVQYGCIGFIVALASFSGARYCKRMNVRKTNQQILFRGNSLFFFGSVVFLLSVLYLSFNYTLLMVAILVSVFVIFFGLSCMLPVCLSGALVNHKGNLGISGAVLGLYYYSVVGGITYLMSYVHTSSLMFFPLFLLFWFITNSILIKLNGK